MSYTDLSAAEAWKIASDFLRVKADAAQDLTGWNDYDEGFCMGMLNAASDLALMADKPDLLPAFFDNMPEPPDWPEPEAS